ncbi:hypothetical protein SAMN05216474_1633 [Lishizhenia tianjinensis]|uniref:Lipocalin-like domain-containing protein n=1 Tax=Lishizhenia tianjinensis TaxID=477690 RepID=A0A1I6ZUK3_9FLAO|nr:hypothetical protein [Lishizhenia tianjinensis]SFT66364.1 hypothetical protein SAMN05216474_1633 [Lishizhenia tianjinensis]
MKTVKSLVLLALIGASVVACKKGEDDPFLSLRTRDARISGEWKLESYSSKDIQILTYNLQADTIYYESFDFDGDNEIYYYVDTASSDYESIEVDYTMTIEKDGSYTQTTDYLYGQSVTSGNWWWSNDGKNKTKISFDDSDHAYEVRELRNDKLVITRNYSNEITVDSLQSNLLRSYTEKRSYSKVK